MRSEDIAKLAGVSRSTVSRVLNNNPNVQEETRKKVQAVIEKYNYVPDSAARSLAGIKNRIIGLFVIYHDYNKENTDIFSVHDSPYMSEFMTYATDAAEKRDYSLLTSIIDSNEKYSKIRKLFKSKIISGAILIGGETKLENLIELIQDREKMILVDEKLDGDYSNILEIISENYEGAYLATKELIDNGHVKIGHIAGKIEKYDTIERLRGFKNCLADHGIKFDEKYLAYGDFTLQSGYNAMEKIYRQSEGELPTAIFASNDLMAIKAVEFFKNKNLSVPDDISIIGFDNDKISEYLNDGLSTISRPVKELAHNTVDMIIDFIEKGDKNLVEHKKVKSTVIRRKTVKKIK